MQTDGRSYRRSSYWVRLTQPLAEQALPLGVWREFRTVDLLAARSHRLPRPRPSRAQTVRGYLHPPSVD